MVGIRKWVRQKLALKGKEKGRQPTLDPLPFLPAQRPRVLTATSSTSREGVGPAQLFHNYGLFGRLPYELRRQILVEAFGGRTVHLDFAHGYPLVRAPRTSSDRTAGALTQHCGFGYDLAPDTAQPQGWQWFGCVCHRRAGYSGSELEERCAANDLSRSTEPCDDRCLEGLNCVCGQTGPACFVGIMGFLSSCRQAYTEGIDILYSTNTFHLSSLDLLLNLPRLLPHPRLSSVTSLELLWNLNRIHSRQGVTKDMVKPLWDDPTKQDTALHALCTTLTETFPHLCKLYISFQCWLSPGVPRSGGDGDAISEMETIFLGPVEQMLRALGPRPDKEFRVAIQRGAWVVLHAKYHSLLGTALRVESVDDQGRGRFWKPLCRLGDNGDDDNGRVRGEEDGIGYWICSGWEDIDTFGHDYWTITHWGNKWTGTRDTF